MVLRGRKLLVRALGEEGWQVQAQSMRAEADQFLSLDETRREAQCLAEALDISLEEALQDVIEERRLASQREESPARPEL
jgi:hypothetical protein